MIIELADEAVSAGAGIDKACAELGVTPRTLTRWRAVNGGEDRRGTAPSSPDHKLTEQERKRILEIANSQEYRDLSPRQIVPLLADKQIYVASEASF